MAMVKQFGRSTLKTLVHTRVGNKIPVVFGGKQSCTDGRSIYVADLPDSADENVRLTAEVHSYHEAEHVKVLNEMKADPSNGVHNLKDMLSKGTAHHKPEHRKMAGFVVNVLEDIRIDRRANLEYPGTTRRYRESEAWMSSKMTEEKLRSSDPVRRLLIEFILRCRNRFYAEQIVEPLDIPILPEDRVAYDKLLAPFEEEAYKLDTFDQVLAMSDDIVRVITQATQPPPPPQDSEPEEGDSDVEKSRSPHDSASDGSSGEDDSEPSDEPADSDGSDSSGDDSEAEDPAEDEADSGKDSEDDSDGGEDGGRSDEDDSKSGSSDDEGSENGSADDEDSEETSGAGESGEDEPDEEATSSGSASGETGDSPASGSDSESEPSESKSEESGPVEDPESDEDGDEPDEDGDEDDEDDEDGDEPEDGEDEDDEDVRGVLDPNAVQNMDTSNLDEGKLEIINTEASGYYTTHPGLVDPERDYRRKVNSTYDWAKDGSEFFAGQEAKIRQMVIAERAPHKVGALRRGKKLDTHNLHKIRDVKLGKQPAIWSRTLQGKNVSTAVMISIDESGSMAGDPWDTCVRVVSAFTRILDTVRVKYAVAGWSSDYATHLPQTVPEERFSPTMHTWYHRWEGRLDQKVFPFHPSGGGTPSASGLEKAMKELSSRTEDRRILFFLTDGDPCTSGVTTEAELAHMAELVGRARSCGAVCFGFGINITSESASSDRMSQVFGDHWVPLPNFADGNIRQHAGLLMAKLKEAIQ